MDVFYNNTSPNHALESIQDQLFSFNSVHNSQSADLVQENMESFFAKMVVSPNATMSPVVVNDSDFDVDMLAEERILSLMPNPLVLVDEVDQDPLGFCFTSTKSVQKERASWKRLSRELPSSILEGVLLLEEGPKGEQAQTSWTLFPCLPMLRSQRHHTVLRSKPHLVLR